MIAVDTNILLYAHRRDSPFHGAAASCVRELAEGSRPWAIPWPCLYEFLSISTHPRVFKPPTPLRNALNDIEVWLESPTLRLLCEHDAHWSAFKQVLLDGKIAGPTVHDARIAALCLAHGVTKLYSADRDFSRFSELTVINPLVTR